MSWIEDEVEDFFEDVFEMWWELFVGFAVVVLVVVLGCWLYTRMCKSAPPKEISYPLLVPPQVNYNPNFPPSAPYLGETSSFVYN